MQKFKVWDSKNKHFLDGQGFFLDCDGRLFFWAPPVLSECLPHLEVVFSTGKTDKNGVELYEGDYDELGYTVTWCGDNQAGLGMNCGWYYQKNDFDKWIEIENGSEKYFEKIGSKYENPELLEPLP